MNPFTDEQKEFIKNNVVGRYNEELADLLNEKFGTDFNKNQIKNFKRTQNLRSGLGGWNRPRYKIGDEFISNIGFILVKTEKGWKYKHRLVWEKYFGAIPKDKVIVFLDKNRLNCNIENLLCIDRKVLAYLNRNQTFKNRTNADVTKVCIALAALRFRIQELEQKNENKKRKTR